MLATATPAFQGLQLGARLSVCFEHENSIRAGHNHHFATALTQGAEASSMLGIVETILETAGAPNAISWPAYLVSWIIPAAVAYGVDAEFENPLLRRTILLIHDHIGIICQVASAISAIALIYFGQVVYGAVLLGTLAIGLLEQTGVFPESIRSIVRDVLLNSGLAAGVFFGGPFAKIFCIGELFNRLTPRVVSYLAPAPYPDLGSSAVNPVEIRNLAIEQTSVNCGHVHYPLPFDRNPPNEDPAELIALCEEIDWTQGADAAALEAKLGDDDRYRELQPQEARAAKIETFKRQLRSCVDSVVHRQILQGEIRDYALLENMLKSIVLHLKKPTTSAADKCSILLSIGIDGGEYCGPAKFGAIEQIYLHQVLMQDETVPLKNRLLILLNHEREMYLQSCLQTVIELLRGTYIGNFLLWMNNPQDRHSYYAFLLLLGKPFGVVSLAAENDELSRPPALGSLLYHYLLRNTSFARDFWQSYDNRGILQSVKEHLGTPYLPTIDIYRWFLQWSQNHPNLTEAQKQEWEQGLSAGGLGPDHTIEDCYLIAMLLEMGILHRAPAV